MGRPSKGVIEALQSRMVPEQNTMQPSSYTAYANNQIVLQCSCNHSKHARVMQCQSATRSDDALQCHIHAGKGSAAAKEFYAIADKEPLLLLYAVEVAAIPKKIQLSIPGSRHKLHLNKKPWDFVSLKPPNLLVEVQGEGHTHKQDNRLRNNGDTLEVRQSKDSRLAKAAMKEGFTVLWLYPGDKHGRRARWSEALRRALQHVRADNKPKLFHC